MPDSDRALPDDPDWLKIAFKQLGQKEVPGMGASATNPRIEDYLQSTVQGPPGHMEDETHWCSAFVNWCIEQAGGKGTNSARARSWEHWGEPTNKPTRGCVAVFARGGAGSGKGHVGFYLSGSPQTGIRIIGGNQSNAVTIATQRLPFLGFRTEDEDMTGEQARQLKALFQGLTVQGTRSPEETVNLMFGRIKNIEQALTVQGTKSAEQGFNALFKRVSDIETMVKSIKQKLDQQP